MNITFGKSILPALTLLVLSAASVPAQVTVGRDVDNEAGNAYQEFCNLTVTLNSASCFLPAPPADKRLAIRYVSADCDQGNASTRNHKISVAGRLPHNPFYFSAGFIPRRVNSFAFIVAEPVFLHSDLAPQVFAYKEGEGNLACTAIVFGYLVNK